MSRKSPDLFGSLNKDVINYIATFLSPEDAVALSRVSKTVHEKVDLRFANWMPRVKSLIEGKNSNQNNELDYELLDGFAATFKQSGSVDKQKEAALHSKLAVLGAELTDFVNQYTSSGQYQASNNFWLVNMVKSVATAIHTNESTLKNLICYLLYFRFVFFGETYLSNYVPKVLLMPLTYGVPIVHFVYFVREAYGNYDEFLSANRNSANNRLLNLIELVNNLDERAEQASMAMPGLKK